MVLQNGNEEDESIAESSTSTNRNEITVQRVFQDDNDNNDDINSDNAPFPQLPNMNRIDCSSHKLDKLGKIDVENAKTDPVYNEIHSGVLNTLEKIWSLKDSRLSAEVFTQITNRKLIGPHRIRWLKTFDAVCKNNQC